MAAFRYSHRVTYADCTVGDHIYYARYLDLLEAARNELFREVGFPMRGLQEQDAIFPVVDCHLRYKAPARYDDLLTIEQWLAAAEGLRLNFAGRVFSQSGGLLVESQTIHACTTIKGRPRRLPDGLRSALMTCSHVPETG